MWLVSWSENKQKWFKLWSQKQFNPRRFRNYRNNKNKTFGCCSFFHRRSGGTPRIPSGAFWVMSMLRCLHSALRGKTTSFASKRAPIFLSNRERERRREGEKWKWERCFHLQTSFKMDSKHYQGRTYAIYYTLIWIQKQLEERPVSWALHNDWSQSTECSQGQSQRCIKKCHLAFYIKTSMTT